MDAKPIVGRALLNSALMALLAVAVLVTGCVPPKNKAPKGEAVTSAPAPSAAAPEDNPLSHVWQRLVVLEGKSGGIGSITIGNAVAGISEEAASAKNARRIEIDMDVTGQLGKSFVEAVMNLDASPAQIVGVDTGVTETAVEGVTAAAFSNKGRAGWRMRKADGQVSLVSQKVRLHIEAPKGMQSIELLIQRSFKKANGDLFNSSASTPGNVEAQRLLGAIKKERVRRANATGGDVAWLGVGDCASVNGEQKDGQCYPTDVSWRLAEKRAAALDFTPWMEKVTIRVSDTAVARKKEEPVKAPPVEEPKPVEAAKPAEAPKPVEVAKPVEEPKPVEVAKPAEEPKPVEVAKPVEAPKPVEVAKPVEEPKPVEAAKPAAAPKSVEVAKPAAAPKPVEVAKPVAAPKPAKAPQEPAKKPVVKKDATKPKVNKEGQPIYDLSDVLGKQ